VRVRKISISSSETFFRTYYRNMFIEAREYSGNVYHSLYFNSKARKLEFDLKYRKIGKQWTVAWKPGQHPTAIPVKLEPRFILVVMRISYMQLHTDTGTYDLFGYLEI